MGRLVLVESADDPRLARFRLHERGLASRADRRRETRAVQDDLARGAGDAASVREELEVTGYGSSATWKRGRS